MRTTKQIRKSKGLCPGCGNKPNNNGLIHCAKCLEYYNKYNREWRVKNQEYSRRFYQEYVQKLKSDLREKLGGKCMVCGYNEFPQILEFHELEKLKEEGRSRNWFRSETLRRKAIEEKLVELLCPTCHRLRDRKLI